MATTRPALEALFKKIETIPLARCLIGSHAITWHTAWDRGRSLRELRAILDQL